MKKALLLFTTLAFTLALFLLPVNAAEDSTAKITEIKSQISAVDTQIQDVEHQLSAYSTQEAHLLMAKVIQTSPQFIVEATDFGLIGLLGLGTPYYVVENPQDGKLILGAYCGDHILGEKITIQVNGQSHSATVLKPLPANVAELHNRLGALREQRDALATERDRLLAAISADKYAQIDVLRNYSSNQDTDIIFQIGNPYMFVYEQGLEIEAGNANAKPVAFNGSTMVPIRAVMDAVGGETVWYSQDPNRVELILASKRVVLRVGETTATVNDKPVAMAVAPQVIGGKTMIPLRFVSETMGMAVEWIQENSIIKIVYSKNSADNVDNYCNDLGNGTKEFYDYNILYKYVLPSNSVIEMSPGTSVTITLPEIEGKITVSAWDGYDLSGVGYKEIAPTEKQIYESVTPIYTNRRPFYSIGTTTGEFYAGLNIYIAINAQTQAGIGDGIQMDDPDFIEEIEANYAALEDVVMQILGSLTELASG